jgi:hypothetical protein
MNHQTAFEVQSRTRQISEKWPKSGLRATAAHVVLPKMKTKMCILPRETPINPLTTLLLPFTPFYSPLLPFYCLLLPFTPFYSPLLPFYCPLLPFYCPLLPFYCPLLPKLGEILRLNFPHPYKTHFFEAKR